MNKAEEDFNKDNKSNNFVDPNTGIFYICDVMDRSIITNIIPKIDEAIINSRSMKDEAKSLIFMIDSVGGEVGKLLALLDTIDRARAQGFVISTHVMGCASSCASMLAIYGDKGQRTISKFGQHLVHHFNGAQFVATTEEIERVYKEHKRLDEVLKNLYVDNTKLSAKKYDEVVKCDHYYMDAQEVVKLGLADCII